MPNPTNAPLLELDIPKDITTLKLPDISLLNYYKLREKRIFYIDFEIDDGIMDIQQDILLINMQDEAAGIAPEDRKPIKILINSPGGLLNPTLALCQTMILSKTPIYTYNLGAAFSCGLLILLGGHKRYSLKYSEALIHTGSGGTSGTYEQTQEQGKQYKREVEFMGQYILDRTGMDPKVFNRNKSKDWYLPIADQLKYGIVHETIDDISCLMN